MTGGVVELVSEGLVGHQHNVVGGQLGWRYVPSATFDPFVELCVCEGKM